VGCLVREERSLGGRVEGRRGVVRSPAWCGGQSLTYPSQQSCTTAFIAYQPRPQMAAPVRGPGTDRPRPYSRVLLAVLYLLEATPRPRCKSNQCPQSNGTYVGAALTVPSSSRVQSRVPRSHEPRNGWEAAKGRDVDASSGVLGTAASMKEDVTTRCADCDSVESRTSPDRGSHVA